MLVIKRALAAVVLCLPLTLAASAQSKEQAKEPNRTQPSGQAETPALSNNDVLGMLKAGLAPDVVIAKIKSSPCDFDTSPHALEKLKAEGVPQTVVLAMVEAPSATTKKENTGPCVILKRMGPADQVTSHLYSFGFRGKQFQYLEGALPKGVKFHGRLTDHDVREIESHGGKVTIVDAHYTEQELEGARKTCSQSAPQ